MFRQVPLYNQPLILLNTSRVTDMSEMFHGARAFNQSLSFNCTFAHTFCNATYFDRSKNYTSRRRLWRETFNSPWPVDIDTSRVTYMAGMFKGCSAFNQPLSFDTSSVTDMSEMFQGATAYNQPLSFDTSAVTDMSRMFEEASAYDNGANPNQVEPVNFDTSGVTDMSAMFKKATTFDQPLSFDTRQVTNMEDMFLGELVRPAIAL